MEEFNLEELSKFDGKDGRPAYIALHGWVINVSESRLWKDGLHMKRHNAGKDLTSDIKAAPHTMENLAKFPKVGFLKKAVPEREVHRIITSLIRRFPMLRRHPHPMTVHFPIVFMFATVIFNLIYLITSIKAFEITALHCLGAGILFTPVTITTGFYTWWLNYMAKPVRAVTIKKRLSLILFTIEIVVFIWRILIPDILDSFEMTSAIYLLLVLSLLPLVTIIGWFGAKLTFPIEER